MSHYITSSQGNPIQGVSQQPEKVRLSGQCTECINMYPDPTKGLITRPGSKFINTMNAPARTGEIFEYSEEYSSRYMLFKNADGTVDAIGRFGYLGNSVDTSSFNNCSKLFLGAYNIVNLREDGTCQAVGSSNEYGQLDLTEANGFSNIVKIVNFEDYIVGLKSDGSLAFAGSEAYRYLDIRGYVDIVEYYGDGYALRSDGTAVYPTSITSHIEEALREKPISKIINKTTAPIIIYEDGTCYSYYILSSQINNLTDIVDGDVSDDNSFAVFIKSDGTCVGVGNNTYGQIDVTTWTGVKKVSCGDRHTIGIHDNGYYDNVLIGAGDNTYDQITFDPVAYPLLEYVEQIVAHRNNTYWVDTQYHNLYGQGQDPHDTQFIGGGHTLTDNIIKFYVLLPDSGTATHWIVWEDEDGVFGIYDGVNNITFTEFWGDVAVRCWCAKRWEYTAFKTDGHTINYQNTYPGFDLHPTFENLVDISRISENLVGVRSDGICVSTYDYHMTDTDKYGAVNEVSGFVDVVEFVPYRYNMVALNSSGAFVGDTILYDIDISTWPAVSSYWLSDRRKELIVKDLSGDYHHAGSYTKNSSNYPTLSSSYEHIRIVDYDGSWMFAYDPSSNTILHVNLDGDPLDTWADLDSAEEHHDIAQYGAVGGATISLRRNADNTDTVLKTGEENLSGLSSFTLGWARYVSSGTDRISDSKFHYYNRGSNEEEYFIIINEEGIVRIVNAVTGIEQNITVEDTNVTEYLSEGLPKDNLHCITIGDTTFVVNDTVQVLVDEAITDIDITEVDNTGIINFKFLDYGDTVNVKVSTTLESYSYWIKTKDGSSSSHIESVDTDIAAEHLYDALIGGSGDDPDKGSWGGDIDIRSFGFGVTLEKNTVRVFSNGAEDFWLEASDGANGQNVVSIKNKVTSISDLPLYATDGYTVEVRKKGGNKNSIFYLKAVETTDSTEQWVETTARGITYKFNLNTMPIVIVRESFTEGIANFFIRKGEWEEREVGDDNTNPFPSFVGNTISSINMFQNRLVVTSGDNLIMSRSNRFFNFFRQTTQEVLDTDPIDIFSDIAYVNYFSYTLSFDGDLVIFSDNSQFIVSGSKPITPSNVVMRYATGFNMVPNVEPISSGEYIMFPFKHGAYTGIREFFTDSITDSKRAKPITDHVKEYMKGLPTCMDASTNYDCLIVKTEEANVFYIYKWLWRGTEKIQSAWQKWVFGSDYQVAHFRFSETLLRILIEKGEAYVVDTIDLGLSDDEDIDYNVRVDGKQFIVSSSTSIEDPYPDLTEEQIVVIPSSGAYEEYAGKEASFSKSGGVITLDKSYGSGDVTYIIGAKFLVEFQPTRPIAFDQKGLALNLDRLTVGSIYYNMNNRGASSIEVESKDNTRTYTFEEVDGDSTMRAPVRKLSNKAVTTLKGYSHKPLEIRDIEFSGNLNRRGRRL